MATDGSPIDISILEALIELRKQQAQVDQFCQRAEERKDKVEAAVFSRVMADYGKRRADLEAQAAPLVTRALVEYRKLRASFDAVRATQAAARLDKEEIEFRHALGEVDDPVKAERLKEPERLIAETTEQLVGARQAGSAVRTGAARRRSRGGAAGGAARTAPARAAQARAARRRRRPGVRQPRRGDVWRQARRVRDVQGGQRHGQGRQRQRDPSPCRRRTIRRPAAPSKSPRCGCRRSKRPSSSPTPTRRCSRAAVRPRPTSSGRRSTTASSRCRCRTPARWCVGNRRRCRRRRCRAPPSGDVDVEDRTFIVPEALLLSEADNGQAVNFRLTALTYIGRSEDNQLRLLDPGVSRRHVLVMATPGGYTIRDLGSQNGTYVNGTRVDESPLTDGDRITIGEINLVFRGAPAAVSA